MLFETRLFVKTTTNQLSSLTKLHLSGCPSLASLPPEIGRLSSLTALNLSECHRLASLPLEITRLVDHGCCVDGCGDQFEAARVAYNHLALPALADALYHALPDRDAAHLVVEFFSGLPPAPQPLGII